MTVTIAAIKAEVARFYGIAPHDLCSERRDRAAANARQVGITLARRLTQRSYPVIGRAFGGRDHTTAIYSVKAVEAREREDEGVAKELATLTQALRRQAIERQMASLGDIAEAVAEIDAGGVAQRLIAAPRRAAIGLSVIEIVALGFALAEAQAKLARIEILLRDEERISGSDAAATTGENHES